VLLSKCQHVPSQYSHNMGNLWLSADHCIHQTTNHTCIENMCHVLYLFMCLWKLLSNTPCSHRNWHLYWFTNLHVEPFQNCFNILHRIQPNLSSGSISLNLHSQNEVSFTKILHV
jgi:hypothetical protein